MMKKTMTVVTALALLLIGATALAAAPQLDDGLFLSARKAMGCLSSAEYERVVTLLPFSDVAPSAAEWERFAGNFSTLDNAQTDYAVAYWTGSLWKLAVPAQNPDSGDVEVLVLSSEDGSSFTGYRYATWDQVETDLGSSDHVTWNKEYVGSAPVVVAD